MTDILCRLNDVGQEHAAQAMRNLHRGTTVDLAEIVHADDFTEPLGAAIGPPEFSSRYELGLYLVELLDPLRNTIRDVATDAGVWNWIGLYWMHQLLPQANSESVGSTGRWLLDNDGWRAFSRHLFAAPYAIMNQHRDRPEITRVLLAGTVVQPGSAYEVAGRQQKIVRSPGVLEAMTALYVTPTNSIKPGAATRGDHPGTITRFRRYLDQLERTYDVQTMEAIDLLEMLPSEFDRFRSPG
jgi:hypothetical protein